jgi:uncharacterized protein (DUF1501 family)
MSDHDHDHEMIAPRLMDAVSAGCEESRLFLSRRALMGMSAGLFSWACLPRHAEAFDGDRRLLVVLMRGGLDGLHVAYQNLEKERLRSYRGAMYDAHSRTEDYLTAGYRNLGTTGFRVNAQMSNFVNWFHAGEASLVHSIAPPLRTRSHFDCMDNLENGQASLGNPTKDGWLNRFLAGLQDNEPSSRGLATSGAPLILKGEAQVQSWTASSLTSLGDRFADNLAATYRTSADPLFNTIGSHLVSGLQTDRLADMAAGAQAVPESPLTRSFRGTARLMKALTGPRVAVLSVDGLDTHEGQIMVLDSKLKEMDSALESFRTELGPQVWARTVVDQRQAYGVEPICKVLPIAPSTYHAHVASRRDPARLSERARRDGVLKTEIDRVFKDNFGVYGVRKVWRQMKREGFDVARCTVARLMKAQGLQGVIRGRPVRTTVSDKAAPCPLDLVNRQFRAPRPNVLWLSDFTYVATWQGFVYVAFVIDAYARRIVGWRASRTAHAALLRRRANRNPARRY